VEAQSASRRLRRRVWSVVVVRMRLAWAEANERPPRVCHFRRRTLALVGPWFRRGWTRVVWRCLRPVVGLRSCRRRRRSRRRTSRLLRGGRGRSGFEFGGGVRWKIGCCCCPVGEDGGKGSCRLVVLAAFAEEWTAWLCRLAYV